MKLSSSRRLLAAIVSVGAAGLLSAGAANAAMLSYSDSIPLQNGIPTGFSFGLTLPAFDPADGTLTGVSIELDSTITPIVSVTGFAGVSPSLPFPYSNAMSTDNVELTAPTVDGDVIQSASTGSYSGTITAYYPTVDYLYGVNPATVDDNTVSVSSANFASYELPNNPLNFTFASDGGTYSATGAFVSGTENASAKATITYTYDAVPEPGSFGLLALGGIGLLIKRRKKA